MDRELKYCGITMELSLLPIQCMQGTGVNPSRRITEAMSKGVEKTCHLMIHCDLPTYFCVIISDTEFNPEMSIHIQSQLLYPKNPIIYSPMYIYTSRYRHTDVHLANVKLCFDVLPSLIIFILQRFTVN